MTTRIITDSNGRKHITNEPLLHPPLTVQPEHEMLTVTNQLSQAAQMALESDNPYIRQLAANAVRKAMEQPGQEPTPWRDMVVVSLVREGINKHKARELADHFAAQPVQEPVGYVYWSKGHAEGAIDVQTLKPGTPLYTSPAAQPVQELVASPYNPNPVEYQYHYPDGLWRCSNGDAINGMRPDRARSLYALKDNT